MPTYLSIGAYLKGGAISPSRFVSVSRETVRLRCRGNARDGEGSGGECRLNSAELLTRLLNHVPPRGMQTVRGYGLYADGQRKRLNIAREHCGQVGLAGEPRRRLDWKDVCLRLDRSAAVTCGVCAASLVVDSYFEGGRSPPRTILKPIQGSVAERARPSKRFCCVKPYLSQANVLGLEQSS